METVIFLHFFSSFWHNHGHFTHFVSGFFPAYKHCLLNTFMTGLWLVQRVCAWAFLKAAAFEVRMTTFVHSSNKPSQLTMTFHSKILTWRNSIFIIEGPRSRLTAELSSLPYSFILCAIHQSPPAYSSVGRSHGGFYPVSLGRLQLYIVIWLRIWPLS